ncbi:MAG: hypothetical protein HY340_01810 [Candidatus Kerfeldbacteria bacterium]|nr:hypothetical protein [Candidatus Kerfeldbacteria bacterium]
MASTTQHPSRRLPRSVRKYLRAEKARIRRKILDVEHREHELKTLKERFVRP